VKRGHDVAAVFTQPDRAAGRGRQLVVSPVKEAALRLRLPVHQPGRIRSPEVVDQLKGLAADVMVIVGYGQIIPQSIIDLPKFGIINVHASLLPKYRGAAPIQWAIARGEGITGVTTMRIDAGLDTGDMLLKASTPIGPEESAIELGERLSLMGAELLGRTLNDLSAGAIDAEPQNSDAATYAPILKKEDGRTDFSRPAVEVYNRCRGFLPWPGAFTTFRGHILNIWKAKPANPIDLGPPGTLRVIAGSLLVSCAPSTALILEEVQLEGRKRVSADAFRNGQRLKGNEILGEMKN